MQVSTEGKSLGSESLPRMTLKIGKRNRKNIKSKHLDAIADREELTHLAAS